MTVARCAFKLSEKGLALQKRLIDYFEKQIALLPKAQLADDELVKTNELLRKVERFWSNLINYGTVG